MALRSINGAEVVRTLLDALGTLQRPYGVMFNQWTTSAMVEVEHDRPLPTAIGTVIPFRPLATDGRP